MLLSCLNASQLVLIGDQKQLGPVFNYEVKGPKSMFERLNEAGIPSSLLDISYRMHPALLKVPNLLSYGNRI